MVLINGEIRHNVDISDRGFQYGDGVFETIAVANGKPLFLEQHVKRLFHGCETLLIPPPDSSLLVAEAQQLASTAENAVLKLMLTRGSGGRGYRQPARISPTRVLSLHPFPEYPATYQTDGVRLRFCRQRLAHNPALAGIKHMNRLEQILARAEWEDDTVQEGLMCDYSGYVIEGTMSNLFVVKHDMLLTPNVSNCGVKGILREIVVNFATTYNIGVSEKQQLDQKSVLEADELFVTNSVIGIWPVRQLNEQCFKVGRITRRMQQWYAEARKKEMKS